MNKMVIFLLALNFWSFNSSAVFSGNQDSLNNVWIFIMAGQSNMAGRAKIEPQDTITNQRILVMNAKGEIAKAKEPLHFYEPSVAGLDCGLSFGKTLLKNAPESVSILLVPTAVGGSAIDQWLGDSLHRGVKLLSNFKQMAKLSGKYGTLKAILWNQGESDANQKNVSLYQDKLQSLFAEFRTDLKSAKLPIITGLIGRFKKTNKDSMLINNAIKYIADKDPYTFLIKTNDFTHIGDKLHYDSKSQRKMGERFAKKYQQITPKIESVKCYQ